MADAVDDEGAANGQPRHRVVDRRVADGLALLAEPAISLQHQRLAVLDRQVDRKAWIRGQLRGRNVAPSEARADQSTQRTSKGAPSRPPAVEPLPPAARVMRSAVKRRAVDVGHRGVREHEVASASDPARVGRRRERLPEEHELHAEAATRVGVEVGDIPPLGAERRVVAVVVGERQRRRRRRARVGRVVACSPWRPRPSTPRRAGAAPRHRTR